MKPFIYYIYFDKNAQPEKIVCKTYEEFRHTLDKLIVRTGEMPEWIIRVYQ